ncbi:MAG: S8 family serine peptidase [Myxacorys chilensis ATA2-1-KO14]|jgi:subtilisin family serine protease|nr:S8 family serine peptidase [Myxacorys chilensis ATA2-1-KO14]
MSITLPLAVMQQRLKNVTDLRQLLHDFTLATNRSPFLYWDAALEQEDGAGIRVALLDSGVQLQHPLLKGAQIHARDFTGSGSVFDRSGHGTKGATLLVGQTDLRGLVPACTLLVGKVLGGDRETSAAAIAQGIRWAMAQGAQVIALPLGRRQSSPLVKQAVHQALTKGCKIFAAAGNYGVDVCLFPARLPSVVAVSATTLAGVPLSWCCQTQVDCYAPGQDVFPSDLAGGSSINGSSAATVLAAGVAALRMAREAKMRDVDWLSSLDQTQFTGASSSK